jgi:formylglycine-generating enzyme required for sulfatase activity
LVKERLSLINLYGLVAVVLMAACSQQETPESRSSCRAKLAAELPVDIDGRTLLFDQTEVTNAQFKVFVETTGYLTRAERGLPEPVYDGLPAEARVPGSAVFIQPSEEGPLNPARWWRFVPGANWMHPEGPASSIDGKDHYPVVHIAYEDAQAYAVWAGRRLPTAEEWEVAARGGLVGKEYEWGDAEPQGNEANFWQGVFPVINTRADGFAGLAPSGCFKANGYGLHDMTGNVWEWTSTSGGQGTGIVKGGSYLCARNYCSNYRPGAVHPQDLTLGTSHIGFRTVAQANAADSAR